MGKAVKGLLKDGEVPDQGSVTVKIERGPYVFSNLGNGNLFAVELLVLVLEEIHLGPP
jgi:hypothetical protein